MQTVSEINKVINQLVAPLFPMKVKDFGLMHKAIQDAINPFLSSVGMTYGVWRVRMDGDLAYNQIDCFKAEEDFIKDKRCSDHNRYGTMNKMWFSACSPEFESGLLPVEAKTQIETKKMATRIEEKEKHLSELEAELISQKEYLGEMKKVYQKRLVQ